jgi:Fatty acid hydroxylase superfamily
VPFGDGLTASPATIPRRNAGVLTLRDCLRSFARRPSPPLLAGAVLMALGVRLGLGSWSWRDALIAVGLVVLTPPIEWAIHSALLHARPLQLRGRERELLAAREHRAHHEAPSNLDGVLLPRYAIAIFVVLIALTVSVLSFPIGLVIGGDRLAWAATGLVVSLAIVGAYEWCHFLIHTPYRPRSRYYRSIWRGHRLHHFKNERYWFGVTSPVGDRLLGTAPDPRQVPRSATARTLRDARD